MTEETYSLGLIVMAVGLLSLSLLWYLANHAKKVHARLHALRDLAIQASSLEELKGIEEKLLLFANKNCYHRHLTSHAREVLAYIQGRRQTMTGEKS